MDSSAATIRLTPADEVIGVRHRDPNTYTPSEVSDLATVIQQIVIAELTADKWNTNNREQSHKVGLGTSANYEETCWQAILSHHVFRSIVHQESNMYPSLVDVLQTLLTAAQYGKSGISHRTEFDTLRSVLHQSIQALTKHQLVLRNEESQIQNAMYSFAYGLSHEINNPLANIVGRAQQLAKSASDARDKKSLATIVESAQRAHEMLAEMMHAIQRPALNLQVKDIRPFLTSKSKLWQDHFESCQIAFDILVCDESLWCSADTTALDEAISCGLRNALDSCISGNRVELIADRTEDAKGNLQVRLAIIDNGPGMNNCDLEKAWDVYYSGREAGRGLGIGLSKIRRIIQFHGGSVWIDSDDQAGFALEIRLPWRRKPTT